MNLRVTIEAVSFKYRYVSGISHSHQVKNFVHASGKMPVANYIILRHIMNLSTLNICWIISPDVHYI
jgi:hypothetical protein